MTRYIAKPALFNNKGMKEFTDPKEAIEYLNTVLNDEGANPELDYDLHGDGKPYRYNSENKSWHPNWEPEPE